MCQTRPKRQRKGSRSLTLLWLTTSRGVWEIRAAYTRPEMQSRVEVISLFSGSCGSQVVDGYIVCVHRDSARKTERVSRSPLLCGGRGIGVVLGGLLNPGFRFRGFGSTLNPRPRCTGREDITCGRECDRRFARPCPSKPQIWMYE